MDDKIIFKVNGKRQEISKNVDCRDSLNDYIRHHLNLRGTKVMCREGGCGICIVNLKGVHPVTNKDVTYSVNSCLVSPFSCHGKEITTIEGIGSKTVGYHPVQSRLADFNGSQCGFCSPGWVMSMYSALQSGNKLKMKEIENSFGGNLCRCTGYRPILDAMKSFATDASNELIQKIKDIEDLDKESFCGKTGTVCLKTCDDYDTEKDFCVIEMERVNKEVIEIDFKNHKWFKVYFVDQIYDIFKKHASDSYQLVAGNTAKGVYHLTQFPAILIDIADIDEIRTYKMGTNLEIGGAMTLNEIMDLFMTISKEKKYFSYLQEFYYHLDLVAHNPVRNIGTIAGNLSIKHEHREFPSDIFVMLETVGAVVTIRDWRKEVIVSLPEYLKTNMREKVIIKIDIPPLSENYVLKTYKILPRAQNAHANVNAGFLIKFCDEHFTIEKARIVYGNIDKDFIHASRTELFLKGKNMYRNDTLKQALSVLSAEITVAKAAPEPRPKYRKLLALSLFYKFFLNTIPQSLVDAKYRSGGTILTRELSSGIQIIDTDKKNHSVNQPVIKLEAHAQCAGEAKYINDIPVMPGELHATFVLATIHRGTLVSIDTSIALKSEGVIAVYTASDIPGDNVFTPISVRFTSDTEEILVPIGGTVKYNGQPVAILVAKDEHSLFKATNLVKLSYKDISAKPILTIKDALDAPTNDNRVKNDKIVTANSRGFNIRKVLYGSFETKSQYHFHMETQSCVCIPLEDGIEIHVASQWMDQVNVSVAGMLKVHESTVNVIVRRIGGSFGGKLSRAAQVACACALAATKLNQPIRFVLPFEMNMRCMGKRHSLLANYEVGIDRTGVIQYLKNTFYQDNGCSSNETITTIFTLPAFLSCYDTSTWTISANSVLTDNASNTYMRAPGTMEGIAMIENIMDQIAVETGEDPIKVRIANMEKTNKNTIVNMIKHSLNKSDYYNRLKAVDSFNSSNRWTKKGISLTVMQFPLFYAYNFAAVISIYHSDGSIAVTHSGIEMGQGINTKVAQVVARVFEIPLGLVSVKASNNISTPNGFVTGGSIGSELCSYAALKACKILTERLNPVKNKLFEPTWLEIVKANFEAGIDLNASYMYSANVDTDVNAYAIGGVCVSEVEVDVLTGNHILTRVDILEDVGESLSPLIDVGQVEGAFMTGTGFWTMEHLEYDSNDGKLLTDRTWNYKIPGAKDIPVDFRIYFRQNAPNPVGVLQSKATGEPPLTLAFSVAQAIRYALKSARTDAGMDTSIWFELEYPLTPEKILLQSGTDVKSFTLT